ncbi:MAG: class I SAM-dependent methyltransferase [Chitinispirillia bacterium]|nr:class I SAM-dependent methyltransferase [Chitinispirillia bacterium]MCL2267888.1 class I SAM-dependent methyltransferase [Chitinispirillia bacterium]
MTSEKIYTSNEYLENNPTWHIEDSPWKAKQILKAIKRNSLQPNSICEIGCGAGEVLRQLFLQMNNNISFVGYEISPDAFELCEQRKTDRLNYKLANLFEDTSTCYDIVMAIDVIEHVEDCFAFLRELRKKGTYKIFHIPLEITVHSVLRPSRFLFARKKVGHIHYFLKDTALATLKDTGYEIIDYFYTHNAVELSGLTPVNLIRRAGYKIAPNLTVEMFGGYSLMVLAK